MKFVTEAFPSISPEQILALATINGSIALGIDHFAGSLHVGKNASFIYAPVDSSNRLTLIEKLIHKDFKEKVKLIYHDAI
jgi:imidazolonepropionase-like amidohydrolase